MIVRRLAVLAVLVLAACSSPPARIHQGMGAPTRELHSPVAAAREYLHQGLVLTWGFNHAEAVRSFEQAAALDPECPLAWWGVGYALGPNINGPLTDPDQAMQAHAAAQRALALVEHGSPAEQALVRALVTRYADPPPADRSELEAAFAEAMAAAWAEHPDDPLVGSVYADALMNTTPWDYWTEDGVTPKEGLEDLLPTLEAVLAMAPRHPFANHLYVHATEASTSPERGEAAADRLSRAAPGQGHLVHMPSHTYMRIGRYADAVLANQRALVADDAYFVRAGPQGVYEFYRAHNAHFLTYAAMFLGQPDTAMSAARDLVAGIPPEVLEGAAGFAEGFLATPWHVMVRFGQWEAMLAEPRPRDGAGIALALWHYARGVAYANTDRVEQARAEAAAFEQAAARVTEDHRVGLSPALDVLDIARHMLEGETLYREGDVDGAFAALTRAIELEDGLPYDEPRGWMQPVRHALGALQLEQGRVRDAEATYLADLEHHPENGWALHGLVECLTRRGDTLGAAQATERFEAAWEESPLVLLGSCYCRTR